MFQVSFVALTVRARVRGFDWTLEQAAQDLGASPLRTFWKVTFPLILPGILAAALLSFALSIDDFIITLFNAGSLRHVPAVHLRQLPGEVPARGQRARHGDPDREHRADAGGHALGRPGTAQIRDLTGRISGHEHPDRRRGVPPIRHVFVYGTLRTGDVRWHFLEPFVRRRGPGRHGARRRVRHRASTTRARCSPTTTWTTAGVIHGQTFELRADTYDRAIEVLDEVEGVVDGEYARVVVTTSLGHTAWAYAYGAGLDLVRIESGDWLAHRPLP